MSITSPCDLSAPLVEVVAAFVGVAAGTGAVGSGATQAAVVTRAHRSEPKARSFIGGL